MTARSSNSHLHRYDAFAGVALTGAAFAALSLLVERYGFVLPVVLLVVVGGSWRLVRGVEQRRRKRQIAAICLAVAIRLVAVLGIPVLTELGYGRMVLSSDSLFYHQAGIELAQKPIRRLIFEPFELIDRTPGYLKIVEHLYRAGDPSLVLPLLLNIVLTVPFVAFAYHLSRDHFNRQVAELSVFILALWPSLVFLTARVGHDAIAITSPPLYCATATAQSIDPEVGPTPSDSWQPS